MLMAIFDEAFAEFLWRERDNIINDISERNLCGRLMLYLDTGRLPRILLRIAAVADDCGFGFR